LCDLIQRSFGRCGFGRLEKSAIERIRSQDEADAGMSLNCCIR
jgi:hypothetical protein